MVAKDALSPQVQTERRTPLWAACPESNNLPSDTTTSCWHCLALLGRRLATLSPSLPLAWAPRIRTVEEEEEVRRKPETACHWGHQGHRA